MPEIYDGDVAFDTGSAINPQNIPGLDLDPDTIDSQAAALEDIAAAIRSNTSSIATTWPTIRDSYETPDSEELISLMNPVSGRGEIIATNLETIATALSDFARDVVDVKTNLDSLRTEAYAFYYGPFSLGLYKVGSPSTMSYVCSEYGYTVANGDSGNEDWEAWDRNRPALDHSNDITNRVTAQALILNDLERTCANKIRAIWDGAPLHSYTGEGSPLEYGLGGDLTNIQMPWGGEAKYREEGFEAAFFGIIRGITKVVTETVQFAAAVLGFYDISTGEWGWDFSNTVDALSAVVQVAGALALVIVSPILDPFAPVLPKGVNDALDWGWDTVTQMFPSAEEWAEDPWAAGTDLTLTLASMAIPVGAAATAGVKMSAGVAAKLVKGLRIADDWLNKLDPLTMVGKLTGAGLKSLAGVVTPEVLALIATVEALFPDGVTARELAAISDAMDAEFKRLVDSGVDVRDVYVEARPDGSIAVVSPDGVTIVRAAEVADKVAEVAREGAGVVREPVLVGAGHGGEATVGGSSGGAGHGGSGSSGGDLGDGVGGGRGDDSAGVPGRDGADYDPNSSPNPKVATLFDANGNMRPFDEWHADNNSAYKAPNLAKSEYGELATQAYMEQLGYERIDVGRAGDGNVSANGIDGIYKREVDGKVEYVITESKYNTAGLKNTAGGRQGSVEWIRDRLLKALEDDEVNYSALIELFDQVDELGRPMPGVTGTLAKIDPAGNVSLVELGADGYQIVPRK